MQGLRANKILTGKGLHKDFITSKSTFNVDKARGEETIDPVQTQTKPKNENWSSRFMKTKAPFKNYEQNQTDQKQFGSFSS